MDGLVHKLHQKLTTRLTNFSILCTGAAASTGLFSFIFLFFTLETLPYCKQIVAERC